MSSDLIDRDYILSALGVFNDTANGDWDYLAGIETAKEIVRNAPTIEAEPVRHGHWNEWTATHWTKKYDDNGDPIYKEHKYYQCSECRCRTVIKWAYCPACGCRMDDELPY